jgi:hypothetical protein
MSHSAALMWFSSIPKPGLISAMKLARAMILALHQIRLRI